MIKKWTVSKAIALGTLAVDANCTYVVLYFCYLAACRQFAGTLPYLTTLIGALKASTALVLTAYFGKIRAENTRGGITYDAAMNGDESC